MDDERWTMVEYLVQHDDDALPGTYFLEIADGWRDSVERTTHISYIV